MNKVRSHKAIAHIINRCLQTQTNILLSMTYLSTVIMAFFLSEQTNLYVVWISLVFFSFAFSVTTVRLSNNSIYNRLNKYLIMNVKDFRSYYQLDYVEQKREVALLYQEEFIQAIQEAHRLGAKKIKMNTHAWVMHKVLSDVRVTSLYHVQHKEKGVAKIPFESLLLVSPTLALAGQVDVEQEAFKKRKRYAVVMKRK